MDLKQVHAEALLQRIWNYDAVSRGIEGLVQTIKLPQAFGAEYSKSRHCNEIARVARAD